MTQFFAILSIYSFKTSNSPNETYISQWHLTFLLLYSPSSFCLGQNRILKKPVPFCETFRCPPDASLDPYGVFRRNIKSWIIPPSPHNYWILRGWPYYLSISEHSYFHDFSLLNRINSITLFLPLVIAIKLSSLMILKRLSEANFLLY